MKLSKRLQAVADLVTGDGTAADIGTDHGYLPIYLVESGRIEHAIAMDLRTDPLERARAHIAACHLEGKIDVRLSDGFAGLREKEAFTVIMSGMGGGLMVRLLQAEGGTKGIREYILQPQSEIELVRAYLLQQGFRILKEDMVFEDGKFYLMLKADRHEITDIEADAALPEGIYGRYLPEHRHPVMELFLRHEIGMKEKVLEELNGRFGERIEQRKTELKEDVVYANMLLEKYYGNYANTGNSVCTGGSM